MGLGDRIEQALSALGITKERVQAWVGAPCGCAERQEKLNRLGRWARRVLVGKHEGADEQLAQLLED